MVTVHHKPAYLVGGSTIVFDSPEAPAQLRQLTGSAPTPDEARRGTIAHGILAAHNTSGSEQEMKIKFDCLASHDITYVGIIQTAKASGLEQFPLPYVLTNCHNSLCAVGGTINEDDHQFGLSCAKKYGGIYVPAHQAVIHQYMREMMAGCGKMILGSDSHTRYGALGTMAIGEGGPELVKQLLGRTYDIPAPQVVLVHLTGKPHPGVGPQDVAIALIGAVFADGSVKNKVLEFAGDGVANLSVEYRCGIDVMTTETTCLSSIWKTDARVAEYFAIHGRPEAYQELAPAPVAYYDDVVTIDLGKVEPMIAMPFHPSNAYTIRELRANLKEILAEVEQKAAAQLDHPNLTLGLGDKICGDELLVDQGVIAGCAGGSYENLTAAANLLKGRDIGAEEFSLSVYPASQPVFLGLLENGSITTLAESGATIRTAFCGPCFGAGDVPANRGLSIRHSTRNFPNREGSKPGDGQIASVALMDARSIAATAARKGLLTAATDLDADDCIPKYRFHKEIYDHRVYDGVGHPQPETPIRYGPNIADWPQMEALTEHLLLQVASFITDPVTTTDELIPSGETSSYRSNPKKLSQFALSRKDPAYVSRATAIQAAETARLEGKNPIGAFEGLREAYRAVCTIPGFESLNITRTGIGSLVYARKPGDGSAREQAASCQKVLGGWANIAQEYATKRYRSNLINWGMLPFTLAGEPPFGCEDFIFLPNIREAVQAGAEKVTAYVLRQGQAAPFELALPPMTEDERSIILAGCLINFYRDQNQKA